jgi:hypothetical protein
MAGNEFVQETVAGVWAEMPDPLTQRGPYAFLKTTREVDESGNTEFYVEMDAADRITDVRADNVPTDDFDAEADEAASVDRHGNVVVNVRHKGPMPLEIGVLAAGSTFLETIGVHWTPPEIKPDPRRSRILLPVEYQVVTYDIGDSEQRNGAADFVASIARMAFAERRRREAREEAAPQE